MNTNNDFDRTISRKESDSVKWNRYPDDVLPLWVADMDFSSPAVIIEAIENRLSHPFFGYGCEDEELLEVICDWVYRRHGWKIYPDWLVLVSGVVYGMNWALQSVLENGQKISYQTPIYPPFLNFAKNAEVEEIQIPLTDSGQRFEIDFDLFSKKLEDAQVFAFCNPHNPVGRVYSREELEKIAEVCLKKKVLVCSDEIHCDLVFSGHRHIPFALLSEEIANRTITLMAPSKTFNIPGLNFSFAIVSNPEMRKHMVESRHGLVGHPGVLAFSAAKAAYQFGEEWVDDLLNYLESNRNFSNKYIEENIPSIRYYSPEGTYLAWLDCRGLNLKENPFTFFLENAKVALNNGRDFGEEGEGFVRLNFGTPRAILKSALDKMKHAINCIE